MSKEHGGFALVVSRFNGEVTEGLLRGALAYLHEHNIRPVPSDIYYAPGAFEIPLIAKTLASSGRYRGVICLGCVIKGETAHFEFISLGATFGLMQASLETEVPISFGILTSYSEEQACARSGDNEANKGREAAAACLETANLLELIKNTSH
jgi:6,7-dimethyl-8-ribityllumazine synthase